MTEPVFRKATDKDLPEIVSLLADDVLGAVREANSTDLPESHVSAFAAIDGDDHQFLAVVQDEGRVIGTLQLTFIPGMSRGGMWRGQIEAVRIAADRRGEGIGERMFEWALARCRAGMRPRPAHHR